MPAYINSRYQRTIQFKDQDGAAVDVSAYAFGMEWWGAEDIACKSTSPTVTLTQSSGIDATAAATGSITITLTPSQVDDLGCGMARVLLYQNYSNDTTRTLIAEGSEAVEGELYDA